MFTETGHTFFTVSNIKWVQRRDKSGYFQHWLSESCLPQSIVFIGSLSRNGNSSENLSPRGIMEWQNTIPWGSQKVKSIPRGPQRILRMDFVYETSKTTCNIMLHM